MSAAPDEASLTAEFDAFVHRIGLHIPLDRRGYVYTAFKETRAMAALMRQGLSAAQEPAATYDIRTIARGQ